jgi:hypothetical protein
VSETGLSTLLQAWREALREADESVPGTDERILAEIRARDAAQQYHHAALRMQHAADQLGGRADATADRIASSRDLLERD